MQDGRSPSKSLPGRFLFSAGVVLLPFENFAFAPSTGWAAIAPIVFFLYVLWNVRRVPAALVRLRPALLVLGSILALTSLQYLRHPPVLWNWLDAARSLGLGVTFLIALDLRCAAGDDAGRELRLVAIAYALGLAFGVAQLIVVHGGLDAAVDWHRAFAKRDVLRAGRVQFGFTEPAFASMHVFGVLLPLILLFPRRPERRLLLLVFAGYLLFGAATRFSLRFIVDGLAVLVLAAGVRLARGRRPWRDLAVAVVVLAVAGVLAYQTVPRLRHVLTAGIHADASLASRWFRIHASAIGWGEDPVAFLFGHGLGNLWVPLQAGHAEALADFRSSYRQEVDHLAGRRATAVLCMHARVISEFGLLAWLALLLLLFDRRRPFLSLLVFYVYLPFDSYAFYSVWLLVHARRRPPGVDDGATTVS